MRGRSSPTGAAEEEDLRAAPHTSGLHPEEDRTEYLLSNHSAVSMRLLLQNVSLRALSHLNLYLKLSMKLNAYSRSEY